MVKLGTGYLQGMHMNDLNLGPQEQLMEEIVLPVGAVLPE